MKKSFNPVRAKHVLLALWGCVIRARDKHTCQWCGRTDGKMDGHHVISKGRCGLSGMFDLDNGVTLCFHCHRAKMETHPVEYNDWVRGWLHDKDLDYYQLRQSFEGKKVYFNREEFEIKKKVLEDILLTFRENNEEN